MLLYFILWTPPDHLLILLYSRSSNYYPVHYFTLAQHPIPQACLPLFSFASRFLRHPVLHAQYVPGQAPSWVCRPIIFRVVLGVGFSLVLHPHSFLMADLWQVARIWRYRAPPTEGAVPGLSFFAIPAYTLFLLV